MEDVTNVNSFDVVSFQLFVNPLPTVTISGSTTICSGNTAVITFTGTPGAGVSYTVDTVSAGPIVLSAAGTASVTTPVLTSTSVYSLVGAANTTTSCSQSQAGTATVTVNPLPTAGVAGTATICQNGASPVVTFTGAGGTAPYTFTYTVNGGASQTVTTTAGNSATVSAPTTVIGTFDYCLVSVSESSASACSQNQAGCVTITVGPLPTATISGTATVCQGAANPDITFTGANGTSPYTFTYNINGGGTLSVSSAAGSDSVTISMATGVAGVYDVNLLGVSANTCSQAQSGTATITVSPLPTAAIAGTVTVCLNAGAPDVTFTGAAGTAPYTFSYTINGALPALTVTTTSGNTATVSAPTGGAGTFIYDIVGVQDANGCSQNQAGSATVTVIGLPTATITGTADVCQNGAGPVITFTGAAGTAPYTFTYNINGGAPQTITTTAGNSVTLAAPTAATGTFDYCLLSVQGSGATPCSQNQSGCATITVNPLPTATISGTATLCQNAASPDITFTGAGGTAPYTFTYNINGGAVQTVTTASGNSVTISADTTLPGVYDYNLVSVQDLSSTACSQAQAGTATVTVNTPPAINTPTPIQVCDDNNDGFSCAFDLTIRDLEITGGAPGLTVTYHETAQDALDGVNPITTTAYCNIVAGVQTIYVSVSNTGASQCASFTTLTLQVNQVPVANPVIGDYELCDVNNPGDGIEGFDLPSMDAEILNGQGGVAVTYYTTQADAQGGTNAIDTTVLYNNIPPTPQQIWVRLENGFGCFDTASFNLVVNPLPVVTAPAPMSACATTGGAATAQFDLSLNDSTVSGGVPGMTVSYHASLADAQNETGALAIPYTNTSNPQIIYIRVEDAATGCFDTTTLTLNVSQGPPANAPAALHECDPNNDGFTAFDLTAAYNDIAGGPVPAGTTITFHETAIDAQNGVNPVVSPYTNIVAYNQTLYVNVQYDAPPACQTFVTLGLFVHDTPQGTEIDPLEVCDNDTDGIGTFDLTIATPGILGGLDPATHTVSYYVLQANAQTGTNPITNVLAFNNTTPDLQVIWVSVSNNATGCADVIPLELIVNPLPLAPSPAVSPYTLCDYNNPGDEVEVFDLSTKVPEILMGQTGVSVSFYFSMADAMAGVSPLANLYTNVANAQTIFVVVGNDDTACSVITTMDLRVEPLPSPVPPAGPVVECDPDGDGFAQFDLAQLTLDLLQGAPGVTINYYETEQDAIDGTNPIDSTLPYTNITPLVQFIWVGAEITAPPQCRSTLMIELNVIPSPNVPILPDLTQCDQDGNGQDGLTPFDLTVQTPAVLAAQAGAPASYVVGYYLSQADAQAGTSPIIPADNYINISNPQTIWVGIHDVNNECYDTGSFELMVNMPLALVTPEPLSLCDDGPTTAIPQMEFNLGVKDDEITQGLPGYTVIYYPSYADAIAGTNMISPSQQLAYTNLSNPQTLGVMVTGPDGCTSYTTLDIRVLPLPNPQANPPALEVCDNTLPQGTEIFDLTLNEDYFSNGDPNLSYTYYATQAEAESQVNPIADPTAHEGSGTVWIVVTNNQVPLSGGNCSAITSMELIVNPLPQVAPTPISYVLCDTTGAGTGVFLLGSQDTNVLLAPQNMADFTITYHLTQADAQAGTNPLANNYTNITNPQDIYVSVVNDITGCVDATGVVTLSVAAGATSASPAGVTACADNLTGEAVFDLTLFNTEVLNGQAPAQFTVSYYPTLGDAQNDTNVIANPSAYSTASATLYGVVTNTATSCRSVPAPISIDVDPLPDPIITSDDGDVLCMDWTETIPGNTITLTTALGAGYTFQWYLNGAAITDATGASHTVDTAAPGDYTVVATNTLTGCVSPVSGPFTVILSGAPQVPIGTPGFTINNYFADDQVITITVQGNGSYLYSMDGGPFLANGGVFTGVGPGEHNVVVMDEHGCGQVPIGPIRAINYPHYFTPNGDGIHDTWNITGLNQPTAKLYIFDRYGKLLKQLGTTDDSQGWDGTYNGQLLPSTDYWFTVIYTETGVEREFRAHFSLKR